MENIQIRNHEQLIEQIALLKAERDIQETEIKTRFEALVDSLRPLNIIKSALLGIGKDDDIQNEFAKTGLGIGVNMIVDKLFGKNGFKNFVKAFFIKGTLTTLINHNISKITSTVKSYIADLTHPNGETEEIEKNQTEED
jgi:hypothetical protein